MSKLKLFLLIFLSLGIFGAYVFLRGYDQNARHIDFKLSHGGQAWQFKENIKRLNIVYFGYTQCPDICPVTMSQMGRAFKKFPEELHKDVQFIFINLDTRMDNPGVAAEYAQQFHPLFVGLNGEKQQIDELTKAAGAAYLIEDKPDTELGYLVAHTDRLFLINNNAVVVGSLLQPRSSKVILDKIKEHL